jgi:CheY-like chemotaxis protein
MTGQILLVEDEEHLARGLKFNLEAEGYKTEVVGDGETALKLLLDPKSGFDLLVLDVMLPGKDGFTVASELRQANHFIPLLMLTARGRPEDVLRGFAAGADDYLPKPFDLNILLAKNGGASSSMILPPSRGLRTDEALMPCMSSMYSNLPAARWTSAPWNFAPTGKSSA